jgi:hypothetical protein
VRALIDRRCRGTSGLITGIQPVPKPDVGSCTVRDSLAAREHFP